MLIPIDDCFLSQARIRYTSQYEVGFERKTMNKVSADLDKDVRPTFLLHNGGVEELLQVTSTGQAAQRIVFFLEQQKQSWSLNLGDVERRQCEDSIVNSIHSRNYEDQSVQIENEMKKILIDNDIDDHSLVGCTWLGLLPEEN